MIRRVCVFCGSNIGARPVYRAAAKALGALLVGQGVGLVYGGSDVGLMGEIADTVLADGGEVIGVIPQALVRKEVAHARLTELRVVASMHERKAMMVDLSDAFIALPGGFGTFDELCEVLSWAQLGLHQKPVGMLNVGGYFDSLRAMFDHAVAQGFLRPEHRSMLLEDTDPRGILNRLRQYSPPQAVKWISREET
jgi:uncharacterized protein (TIGR00730 family)